MQTMTLQPGETLPNGYVIVASVQLVDKVIVVGQDDECQNRQTGDRYATWRVDTNDGSCFWGHYFDTLAEALDDLRERMVA